MAKATNKGESAPDNLIQFTPRPRPLRADVPAFDPGNSAHLRAWEAMFDFGVISLRQDREPEYGV